MTKSAIVHRLLYLAFLEIRFHTSDKEGANIRIACALANSFHNIPFFLGEAANSDLSYEEILDKLIEESSGWIEIVLVLVLF